MTQKMGLKEVMDSLRQQMAEAIQAGEAEDLRFDVEKIQVELHTQIERNSEASGKINFWVTELGVGGASKDVSGHVLRFEIKPERNGMPVKMGRPG
jgi:hypothetical protein